MKIDLSFLPTEDRMLLSLGDNSGWFITRGLLIKLVNAWLELLQKVELPDVGFSLGGRDIGQEHALSLEFDGPTTAQKMPAIQVNSRLLQEVTLTVDSLGVRVLFRGGGVETNITLTRKESHLVLEMLARKAKVAGWLNEVVWPTWLGSYKVSE